MKTKNAIIESTFLGKEDHGITTLILTLNYGGSCQGFGMYNLNYPTYGIKFIERILEVLEVESWEGLKGTHCRVIADMHHTEAIGHIIKDQWFNPKELSQKPEKENED